MGDDSNGMPQLDNGLSNEDGESKTKQTPGSSKMRQEDLKKSLEFLNIVDNPPTELRFLSRTEVREPQQLGHFKKKPHILTVEARGSQSSISSRQDLNKGCQDMCTRWLEHLAKSIQEQIKENGSQSDGFMMHRNSEENCASGQAFYDLDGVSFTEMNITKNNIDETSIQLNSSYGRTKKDLLHAPTSDRKTSLGTYDSLGATKSGVDSSDTQVEGFRKCSHGLRREDDSYFEFVARKMDLIKRKDVSQKKEQRSARMRKCVNEFDISVDLLKGKYFNGLDLEEKNSGKGPIQKKVCCRFEKRFKSAPKERINAGSEDVLKANKIRLYPFYETKWNTEEVLDDCGKESSKQNGKTDLARWIKLESKKAFAVEEISSEIKENLKVSSIQFAKKKPSNDNLDFQKRADVRERKIQESMKLTCPENLGTEEACKANDDALNSDFDLSSLLTMSSNSLRETMLLLARITASSQLLRNQQILRLIDNGDIDIGKFLVIKKLLLALNPYQAGSIPSSILVRPRKEILSLLTAVLEFIDRCEKILKQSKGISISKIGKLDGFDIGVDCIKRGIVIGKMPSISVMGYSPTGKCDDEHGNNNNNQNSNVSKKTFSIMKYKKFRAKKENAEELLERKAVSITSLRRSIRVSAMDLATHSGWKRSYLLKRRYLPKKRKIKSLRLTEFKVNAFTSSNLHQKREDDDFPLIATPPSRNSISTSFESNELQDFHVPKEQSILNEIQGKKNQKNRLQQNGSILHGLDLANENAGTVPDDAFTKRSLEAPKRGTKVCEFLKGRISTKLQTNFDLYPKIQKLMSSLYDKTENRDDIKASKEARTDFLSHFKLIDANRYEMYCKAFAKVDKSNKGVISSDMVKMAARFVDSVASCPAKYIEYALTVLDALILPKITIKIFCVICGVLERMHEGGVVISDAVNALNLLMSEGKMVWYKKMFYDSSELDQNFISLETVKLELFAGGMSKDEEQQISEKIVNKESHKISYLDFIAYIPLFIVIHDKICANAFE